MRVDQVIVDLGILTCTRVYKTSLQWSPYFVTNPRAMIVRDDYYIILTNKMFVSNLTFDVNVEGPSEPEHLQATARTIPKKKRIRNFLHVCTRTPFLTS